MPVRLRLQRFGRKKRPFYRIVAADARAPRDGKFIELLGTYDPIPRAQRARSINLARHEEVEREKVKEVGMRVDRIKHWISVGAQPTETVARLLSKANIIPAAPRRIAAKSAIPKSERSFSTSTITLVGTSEAKPTLVDSDLARAAERRFCNINCALQPMQVLR
eukprot:g3371.t1